MEKIGNNGLCEFGNFRLDVSKKILWHDETIVSLPLKSIELLCVLIENKGEVVSKNTLLEKVWGDAFVEDGVLSQNVYLLRKTFIKLSGEKDLIKNIPRRGYLFDGQLRHIEENNNHDSEIIIERHLIERVEIEEIKTDEDANVQSVGTKSILLVNTKPIFNRAYLFAVLLLLVGVFIGTAFLFRSSSRMNVVQAPPFKPHYGTLSTSSAIKTVIVMPFKRLNRVPMDTDALFENSLIVQLGSTNKFNIRPLYTLMSESAQKSQLEKADFVLEGAIDLSAENKFHVNATLLNVKDNSVMWQSELTESDMLLLQKTISDQTANSILNTLTAQERDKVSKRRPTSLSAYSVYMEGYAQFRNRKSAYNYFLEAVKLDPNFAQGYAMLACVRAFDAWKGSPQSVEAKNYLDKAFSLDDTLADAYAVQGFMQIFHEFDWQGGEKSLLYALELDPNSILAHHWLACYLSIQRRLDEAKAEMEKALEYDPTSPTLLADLGQIYYFEREYDKATELCEQALTYEENHIFAKTYLKNINDKKELDKGAVLFDKEKTLKELETRASGISFGLAYINVDPFFDPVRDEPAFIAILKKLNLTI